MKLLMTSRIRSQIGLRASGGQSCSLTTDPFGCGHRLAKQKTREKGSDSAKIPMGKRSISRPLKANPSAFPSAVIVVCICSLLFRSLPAIDKDIWSGIEAGLNRALQGNSLPWLRDEQERR
jgi:hypothetical protein